MAAAPADRVFLMTKCAREGNLDGVKKLVALGCPLDAQSLCEAARAGHLELTQWLHEHGAAVNDYTIPAALEGRDPDVIAYIMRIAGPLTAEHVTCAARLGFATAIATLRSWGCPWTKDACFELARHNKPRTLKWTMEQGCPFDAGDLFGAAAEGAHDEIWAALEEKGLKPGADACNFVAGSGSLNGLKYLRAKGCPWDERSCTHAARHGHVAALEWLIESGAPLDQREVLLAAAEKGQDEVLAFMAKRSCAADSAVAGEAAKRGLVGALETLLRLGCPIDKGSVCCRNAALSGHLSVIEWMVAKQLPFDRDVTLAAAAEGGHAPIVDYLLGQGAQLTSKATAKAAAEGYAKGLKYLRSRGCPLKESALLAAAQHGRVEAVEYLLSVAKPTESQIRNAITRAAAVGHAGVIVDCLLSKGQPLGDLTLDAAIQIGSQKAAKLLLDAGATWSRNCYPTAAATGDLSILQWVEELGCPVDAATLQMGTIAAAERGALEVVTHLIDRGCVLDERMGELAALNGHKQALMWLHIKHGLPLTPVVAIAAIDRGNSDMFHWMLGRGCPLDMTLYYNTALERGHPHIAHFLQELSFPAAELRAAGQERKAAWATAGTMEVLLCRVNTAAIVDTLQDAADSARGLAAYISGCAASSARFTKENGIAVLAETFMLCVQRAAALVSHSRGERIRWLKGVTVACSVLAEASLVSSVQQACAGNGTGEQPTKLVPYLVQLVGHILSDACSPAEGKGAAAPPAGDAPSPAAVGTEDVRVHACTALNTTLWALRNCVLQCPTAAQACLQAGGLQQLQLLVSAGPEVVDQSTLLPVCDLLSYLFKVSAGVSVEAGEAIAEFSGLLDFLPPLTRFPEKVSPTLAASLLTALAHLCLTPAGQASLLSRGKYGAAIAAGEGLVKASGSGGGGSTTLGDKEGAASSSSGGTKRGPVDEDVAFVELVNTLNTFAGNALVAAAGCTLITNLLQSSTPAIIALQGKRRFAAAGGMSVLASILGKHVRYPFALWPALSALLNAVSRCPLAKGDFVAAGGMPPLFKALTEVAAGCGNVKVGVEEVCERLVKALMRGQ